MTAPNPIATEQGFAKAVEQFADETMAKEQAIFEATVNLAYESWVHGSAATGSPGVPRSTRQDPPEGHMADSFKIRWHGQSATIFTRHTGARTIELATRLGKSLVLHVGNGGFHSLELTRLGFLQLVKQAVAEVGSPVWEDSSAGL